MGIEPPSAFGYAFDDRGVGLLVLAVPTVAGHLLAILSSAKLRSAS